MQISLNQFFVRNLDLHQVPESDAKSEKGFDLFFDVLFFSSRPTEFYLNFKIELQNPEEFGLKLSYFFVFNTSEDITDTFRASHFPKVNAPAIAFPYVRAYIQFLTLNSGFKPSILPSINFTQLKDNHEVFFDGEKLNSPQIEAPENKKPD